MKRGKIDHWCLNNNRYFLVCSILLALALFLSLIAGCSSDFKDDWGGGDWDDHDHPLYIKNGYSEIEFYYDPFIQVTPENVAAIYLEPYDAITVDHDDTDLLGVDVIPIEIDDADTYTYEMDYDDDVIEEAILRDEFGNEVLTISQWDTEEEAFLEEGEYTLEVHSNYSSVDIDTDHVVVFLFPDSSYGYVDENHQWLVANAAPDVDMTGIDLTGANLPNADLRNTNISFAYLDYANLENADFSESWLYDSSITSVLGPHVNMRYTDLRESDLSKSNFTSGDFSSCSMNNTKVKNTNFTNGYFTDADTGNVDFSTAITTGVTW